MVVMAATRNSSKVEDWVNFEPGSKEFEGIPFLIVYFLIVIYYLYVHKHSIYIKNILMYIININESSN